MTRPADAHRLLTRALHERAAASGAAAIAGTTSEAWASATFRGARHRMSIELGGGDAVDRAATLASGLDAIEFRLPGHLVADIAVIGQRHTASGVAIDIEALTVEDA